MGGTQASWPFFVAFVGVAVVVAAIIAVNVLAGGGRTGSNQQGTGLTAGGASACPEFFEHADTPWVPARPAGAHPKDKLVPTLHPTHVTICRYAGRSRESLHLAGQRELTGKLDVVVDSLRTETVRKKISFACIEPPASTEDYLIGMRYAEAIVWVSAPGEKCLGSSNGSRYSHTNLSAIAAASYAARTWVSSPK